MVRKIRNIIVGWFRYIFKKEPKFAKNRRWLCDRCSFKESFCGMEICSKCYCVIDAKVRVEDERCLDGKW